MCSLRFLVFVTWQHVAALRFHTLTHRVHLHASAKVSQLQVSVSVQQHVVRLDVAVDEAHGVNGVQGHHHLGCVELGPLLWYIVGAGEVNQVASWHVLHHHVEVVVILEGTAQLKTIFRFNNLTFKITYFAEN